MNTYYIQTGLKNSRMMLLLAFSLLVQCTFAQKYYTLTGDDLNVRKFYSMKSDSIYQIEKKDTLLAIGDSIVREDKTWLKLKTPKGLGYAVLKGNKGVYLKEVKYPEPPHPDDTNCNNFISIKLPHNAGSTLQVCLNNQNMIKDSGIDYMIKDILFVRDLTETIPYSLLQCGNLGNNCVAVSKNDKAYIVMNNKFMSQVLNEFGEKAVYFILAHEIAHHNKFHMSNNSISISEEEEADYSAGSMLKRIGATKEDLVKIQKFLSLYSPTSKTHGTSASRMKKVEEGWSQTPKWDSERVIQKKMKERGYSEVGRFRSDFAWVKKNNRLGFVNHLGREVIPPIYSEVENFTEIRGLKLTIVKNMHGNWLTINKYNAPL